MIGNSSEYFTDENREWIESGLERVPSQAHTLFTLFANAIREKVEVEKRMNRLQRERDALQTKLETALGTTRGRPSDVLLHSLQQANRDSMERCKRPRM